MKKEQKKLVYIAIALFVIVLLGANLYPLTVMSVSKLYIDPQGYEDPVSHEWRGSFWNVVMVTDWTDQIAGFHLVANEGDPSETYAESLEGKTYAQSYTVDGKELVPSADVMVHVTPGQPYYERPLEIQQGYYSKKTYATGANKIIRRYYPKTGTYVEGLEFIHYSFGSGSWTLHTPFKVDVYKDGALIGSKEVDTVGGTGVYRIPTSGDEFINVIDLGKLGTGYGEPQWDDILYFSDNHIFVRDSRADNLLRYDGGQTPKNIGLTFGEITANCFNSYYFGYMRWISDNSPLGINNQYLYPFVADDDFPGWYRQDTTLEYIARPRPIKCLEGTGSATITLTKDPTDAPASFTPTLGTQTLTTGQSQTLNFNILNLGTPEDQDFSIIASVKNSLGSVTDTATAHGRLLKKTGATTILHVITQFEGKPISNLPVMIEYSGTSQTKTTGLDGLGTVTFNLGTSADTSVKATFAGNAVYQPASKTTTVSGGSEKTLTLFLTKHDITPSPYDWTTILLVLAVGVGLILFGMYYFRGKRRPRRSRRKNK